MDEPKKPKVSALAMAKRSSVSPASRDRHVDSSYFLKGILKSNDGHPLTGRTTGTPQTRYYAIHRGFTTPKVDKTMRRLIPAEELEQTVLQILSEVMLSASDLKETLVSIIQQQRDERTLLPADMKNLEAERIKLQNQIEFVIDSLSDVGREAARTKLQQLEGKLSAIMQKIADARTESATSELPANEVADDIIAKLVALGKSIKTLPMQTLRGVAQSMIRKLEVDMTTKAVQIEIGLPNWTDQNRLCLDQNFFSKICLPGTDRFTDGFRRLPVPPHWSESMLRMPTPSRGMNDSVTIDGRH